MGPGGGLEWVEQIDFLCRRNRMSIFLGIAIFISYLILCLFNSGRFLLPKRQVTVVANIMGDKVMITGVPETGGKRRGG